MSRRREALRHRRPVLFALALTALVVVVAGGVLFGWRWTHSGAHELSSDEALRRLGSTTTLPATSAGEIRPAPGVYPYVGSGTERVSRPPKSQSEGPGIPGTVTWSPSGCWEFRLDYSSNHWQSTTYCQRGGALVNTGRSGWYRWDFVVVVVTDTARYSCEPAGVAVPAVPRPGARYPFTCTGGNEQINTGPVTMSGWTEVIGSEPVTVAGRAVPAVHVREELTITGGQTGTNRADTWYATADGLPLRSTWTTDVNSPSPVGTTNMSAGGTWALSSLTPRS